MKIKMPLTVEWASQLEPTVYPVEIGPGLLRLKSLTAYGRWTNFQATEHGDLHLNRKLGSDFLTGGGCSGQAS